MIQRFKPTFLSLLALGLAGCSAEWSTFQGAKWTRGGGSSKVANGTIQANWERTFENRLKVQGQLDFKLEMVIIRSFRNQLMIQEQSVPLDTEGRFSADLDDSRFAQLVCVEVACFEI